MQKLLFHPLTAVLITGAVVIFLFSLYRSIQDIRSSTETLSVLDQENQKLASEVFGLEKNLQTAESDFAKEKIIRDELLMQKPGELVIQLPPLPSPSPVADRRAVKLTPWEEWRDLLFR